MKQEVSVKRVVLAIVGPPCVGKSAIIGALADADYHPIETSEAIDESIKEDPAHKDMITLKEQGKNLPDEFVNEALIKKIIPISRKKNIAIIGHPRSPGQVEFLLNQVKTARNNHLHIVVLCGSDEVCLERFQQRVAESTGTGMDGEGRKSRPDDVITTFKGRLANYQSFRVKLDSIIRTVPRHDFEVSYIDAEYPKNVVVKKVLERVSKTAQYV